MPHADLTELLRKIDLPSLRTFAGETIIKAIESVTPANYEGQLCEILKLKYGNDILAERPIRLALLDSLKEGEARTFCSTLGLSSGSHAQSCANLQHHFTGWTEKKSEQFISLLNLSPDYRYQRIVDTRPPKETIAARFGETVILKGILHPYQKRIKDEIVTHSTSLGTRFLVQMPTGSGKTYTALEASVDMFRLPRHNRFAVWLVDSNELAEQAFEAFKELWHLKGDKALTLFRLFKDFSSDYRAENGGIVFTSFDKFHSVLKNPAHAAHQSTWHLVKNTQLLIVDEAHTSVAPTYEECIRAFINTDACVVMGLTATPGRRVAVETIDLTRLYSTTLISITGEDLEPLADPIKFLQDGRYLAKLTIATLETNVQAGGTPNEVCTALAKNPERNKRIIEQIKLAVEAQQPTLVFACTLDHVFALKILCAASGVDCRVITGATPQTSRIAILDAFRREAYYILINLDLLSTGIDLPNVQKIIITRPIGSPILYSQILGRALRGPLNGGRTQNTVLTLKDNLANYPSEHLVYSYFSEQWNNPNPVIE
jgi:superfamily II DNA or RNA helicase